jgi:MFS family permease
MVGVVATASGAAADGRERAGAYAWYVVGVLALAHLVSFVDRFIMALALAPIKASFHVSDTTMGLLNGMGFVVLYCVAAIPLGRYVDVGHRRNLIIFGIVLWSLATAACGMAQNIEQLLAARVIVGLGEACLVPAALSLIGNYFPRQVLARAVALFTTGATLGASTALIGGGALLGWIVARGGLSLFGLHDVEPWRWIFIGAALPGVAVALLLVTVREPARLASADPQAKVGIAVSLAHIKGSASAYAFHLAAACAVIILYQAMAAWTPVFLVRRFGLTVPQSGALVGTLLLFAGPLGNLFGGWLTDRLHAAGSQFAPATVLAIILGAVALPAAIFCLSDSLLISTAGWTVLMTCVAAGVPATWVGIQMITPDRLKGSINSLYLATFTLIGVGMGPILVGLFTDHLFRDEGKVGLSLLVVSLGCAFGGCFAALCGRKALSLASHRVALTQQA